MACCKPGSKAVVAFGRRLPTCRARAAEVIARATGQQIFEYPETNDPLTLVREAHKHAQQTGFDTLLIDTAGRLHIDDELMEELVTIKNETHPVEILFVADAMTGQDAVRSAEEFHRRVGITGVILTKMDGDARGGAALSIKQVTGQPVKFVGVRRALRCARAVLSGSCCSTHSWAWATSYR